MVTTKKKRQAGAGGGITCDGHKVEVAVNRVVGSRSSRGKSVCTAVPVVPAAARVAFSAAAAAVAAVSATYYYCH